MKRYLERQQEEGWRSVGDKHVCRNCFSDYAIANFIDANALSIECSYCGAQSEEPIAAEMDEVLSFMSQGLWREYDIPENCLPYETAEGGWQLVTPIDGYDLVADSGWVNEDSKGFDELFEDLQAALSDRSYVRRDPLAMSDGERLSYSWETFCQTVKHKTRFVIFKVKPKRRSKRSYDPDDLGSIPVYGILENIGRMVARHRLIREIPRRKVFIRSRQHEAAKTPTKASELGAPPSDKASQSRMSPAGISMFYGAEDEKTAFLETYDAKASGHKDCMSFGRFITARKLRILDLSAMPGMPSIFDEVKFGDRQEIGFLHDFARDISKPIDRDDRVHYEYVPTQIVSEYFRTVVKIDGQPVDGIAFNSSRKGATISYCIFTDAKGCADEFRDKKAALFSFDKKRPMLVLEHVSHRPVVNCVRDFGV